MTATLMDRAVLFLHRAGLLAGLLAVIAGIVGMHILTGSHDAHIAGSSAAPQNHLSVQTHAGVASHHPAQPHAVVAQHAGHEGHDSVSDGNQDYAPAVSAPATGPSDAAPTSSAFSCLGGDPCAGMSSMGGSCVPSGNTGSLAAPPPSTVSFAADTQAPEAPVSGYTYLPESPSPADLCISRT